MNRRDAFKRTGLSLMAVSGPWLAVGQHAWAATSPSITGNKRLVLILLRGAVDGLSVVVPYADNHYYRHRSTIALSPPGTPDGVLDLDGRFGLHPALAPVMGLWQSKQLAFVHAAGSPDGTRSHFDAQDYMESGTPGIKSTSSGWMNRLLGVMPPDHKRTPPSDMRAISMGPTVPRIYAGPRQVTNVASGIAATRPTVLDRPKVSTAFDQLYAGDDKLSQAYRQAQQTHQAVMADMADDDAEMKAANNGAPLPNGFAEDAARLGTLFRKDARIQFGVMALGGWDTHANQGASKGQLASRLAPLATGLTALAQQMGPTWNDTVVVVMSEFGRTVKQNGNGGTDHGHGNVMWLAGGAVAGGQVAGLWPGLDDAALYEGRDLPVTTDFREVLCHVLNKHLGLSGEQLKAVFPQGPPLNSSLSLIKA